VVEEVNRVLGKRSEITYQDITELKYCSAVFKEALRLWPPVPVTIRRAPCDVVIDGYHVPKHTLVHVSTYANARQEKFFKDAEEFKPERFFKDSETMQTS
jgi:cytochrome P450